MSTDEAIVNLDEAAYPGEGTAVNSGPLLDGKTTAEAKKAIVEELARAGRGGAVTNYRLRDWVFSRCVILCEERGSDLPFRDLTDRTKSLGYPR